MRRLLLLVLTLSLSLSSWGLALSGPAGAAPAIERAAPAAKPTARPKPPPWLKVENGATQPQFALADAIEETLFVETAVDSDLDGKRDRVRL
jgi:X-Pro dipeptidyl-peptidase